MMRGVYSLCFMYKQHQAHQEGPCFVLVGEAVRSFVHDVQNEAQWQMMYAHVMSMWQMPMLTQSPLAIPAE